MYFLIVGTLSYYLYDYVEGYTHFENWKDQLVGLLKWEPPRTAFDPVSLACTRYTHFRKIDCYPVFSLFGYRFQRCAHELKLRKLGFT